MTSGDADVSNRPLWQPSADRIAHTKLIAFMAEVGRRWGVSVRHYDELYRFSIDRPDQFWVSVWDFCGVIAATRGETIVTGLDRMPGARFFPDARLNFAENLLRRRDAADALVFWGEDRVRRRLSFAQLHAEVSRLVGAFRDVGVRAGDRVGAYTPNIPEAVIGALAAASIGAIWSSCSPDFGVQGVLDRFAQIEPVLLISADGYYFKGEPHDSLEKLREIRDALPSVRRVVVAPYTREEPPLAGLRGAVSWAAFIEPYAPGPIAFEQLPFDHPLYILYSSGTTGVPKCIVHGAGGTLIQHLKEHQLLCDVHPGDRVFYFTTCGWMMWNWLVSVLASEATALLFDGSPFQPGPEILFDLADEAGMTLFGTSARFIDGIKKAGLAPARSHRLPTLRTMTSTGSPLAPESFDYVYAEVKRDVHLASISGGTDIISCFVGGNPIGPVWRGEIQAPALGMRVEVFDEKGRSVREEKGELVCTMPFPSMPIGFWNDPDGSRYHAAYFEKYPGVWAHGDYAEFTRHGGIVIHGRSDAVLNPGGVRIGTAEIYRQVERLDEVVESLVIGQQWHGDERIVLFVRLRDGLTLDAALIARIKAQIRRNATPRHVPARIVQVPEVPRTKSGKIVELAVRDIVHGREPRNTEALANPAALDGFRNLAILKS